MNLVKIAVYIPSPPPPITRPPPHSPRLHPHSPHTAAKEGIRSGSKQGWAGAREGDPSPTPTARSKESPDSAARGRGAGLGGYSSEAIAVSEQPGLVSPFWLCLFLGDTDEGLERLHVRIRRPIRRTAIGRASVRPRLHCAT